MSSRSKCLILAGILAALLVTAPASAGSDQIWTGHAQFGGSWPQSPGSNAFDPGFSLHGGATWHPSHKALGVRFDLGWDAWGLSGRAENELNVGGGWSRVISATAEAFWEPESKGALGFYAGIGLGPYFGYFALTEPVITNGYWCDYWWGVCYPVVGTTDAVVADEHTIKIGYKASVGLTFKSSSRTAWYIEAQYNYMEVRGGAEYIPVAIGARW